MNQSHLAGTSAQATAIVAMPATSLTIRVEEVRARANVAVRPLARSRGIHRVVARTERCGGADLLLGRVTTCQSSLERQTDRGRDLATMRECRAETISAATANTERHAVSLTLETLDARRPLAGSQALARARRAKASVAVAARVKANADVAPLLARRDPRPASRDSACRPPYLQVAVTRYDAS
jgi:hypothetical protein